MKNLKDFFKKEKENPRYENGLRVESEQEIKNWKEI